MDSRLTQALQRIREKVRQPFSVKELAAELGMSEGHLQRLFRREIGVSPYAIFQRLRAEDARRMLLDRYSLREVAETAGYCNEGHLIRSFKSHFGTTPARYLDRLGQPTSVSASGD